MIKTVEVMGELRFGVWGLKSGGQYARVEISMHAGVFPKPEAVIAAARLLIFGLSTGSNRFMNAAGQ
ncbi:hypothetical protein [Simplicispira suum]|uniref:hypothetical protein n=1 Tax=Simplicispira suum TaxID=2109915 RepID=UPI0011B1F7D6|nr:hypothetical protein [Simplicispira suum]